VPGLDAFLFSMVPSSFSFSLPAPDGMLAYVGLGAGQELIPYFLILLGFVGGAIIAVLQWPLTAFVHLLRKVRGVSRPGLQNHLITAVVPQPQTETGHDKP
jgi:hypothetical protein